MTKPTVSSGTMAAESNTASSPTASRATNTTCTVTLRSSSSVSTSSSPASPTVTWPTTCNPPTSMSLVAWVTVWVGLHLFGSFSGATKGVPGGDRVIPRRAFALGALLLVFFLVPTSEAQFGNSVDAGFEYELRQDVACPYPGWGVVESIDECLRAAVDLGLSGRSIKLPFTGMYTYVQIGSIVSPNGINLAEVQAYDAAGSLVAAIDVQMSTTYSASFSASKCTDGDKTSGSTCHTKDGGQDPDPWLLIAYPIEVTIAKIVVTNRVDCCQDRITGAAIAVTTGEDDNHAQLTLWSSVFTGEHDTYTFLVDSPTYHPQGCSVSPQKHATTCQSRSKGDLATIKGEGAEGTCVFPFTYSGKSYRSCATPDEYGGVGWCAWDKGYQAGRWGYCTDECPQEMATSTLWFSPPGSRALSRPDPGRKSICRVLRSKFVTSCQSRSKGDLVTKIGEDAAAGTCVFPFVLNSHRLASKEFRIFSSCAEPVKYGGVGWCAWDSHHESGSGRWGFCTEQCPQELSPPKQQNWPCTTIYDEPYCTLADDATKEQDLPKCPGKWKKEEALDAVEAEVAALKEICSARPDCTGVFGDMDRDSFKLCSDHYRGEYIFGFGSSSGTCVPGETKYIDTKEECEIAAAELGIKDESAFETDAENYPYGCSVDTSADKVAHQLKFSPKGTKTYKFRTLKGICARLPVENGLVWAREPFSVTPNWNPNGMTDQILHEYTIGVLYSIPGPGLGKRKLFRNPAARDRTAEVSAVEHFNRRFDEIRYALEFEPAKPTSFLVDPDTGDMLFEVAEEDLQEFDPPTFSTKALPAIKTHFLKVTGGRITKQGETYGELVGGTAAPYKYGETTGLARLEATWRDCCEIEEGDYRIIFDLGDVYNVKTLEGQVASGSVVTMRVLISSQGHVWEEVITGCEVPHETRTRDLLCRLHGKPGEQTKFTMIVPEGGVRATRFVRVDVHADKPWKFKENGFVVSGSVARGGWIDLRSAVAIQTPSTGDEMNAGHAVNGDLSLRPASCARAVGKDPSWEVDLGATYAVRSIRVVDQTQEQSQEFAPMAYIVDQDYSSTACPGSTLDIPLNSAGSSKYTLQSIGACPIGTSHVDGAQEEMIAVCSQAAAELGLADTTATVKISTAGDNYPHGCYFEKPTGELWVNSAGSNASTDSDRMSICIVSSPVARDIACDGVAGSRVRIKGATFGDGESLSICEVQVFVSAVRMELEGGVECPDTLTLAMSSTDECVAAATELGLPITSTFDASASEAKRFPHGCSFNSQTGALNFNPGQSDSDIVDPDQRALCRCLPGAFQKQNEYSIKLIGIDVAGSATTVREWGFRVVEPKPFRTSAAWRGSPEITRAETAAANVKGSAVCSSKSLTLELATIEPHRSCWNDRMYVGGDLRSTSASSASACQSDCDAEPSCAHWTFREDLLFGCGLKNSFAKTDTANSLTECSNQTAFILHPAGTCPNGTTFIATEAECADAARDLELDERRSFHTYSSAEELATTLPYGCFWTPEQMKVHFNKHGSKTALEIPSRTTLSVCVSLASGHPFSCQGTAHEEPSQLGECSCTSGPRGCVEPQKWNRLDAMPAWGASTYPILDTVPELSLSLADPLSACGNLSPLDHTGAIIIDINRGDCPVAERVLSAMKANATAVVMFDSGDPATNLDRLIELGGGDSSVSRSGAAENLQACTGECDSDDQCAPGLKCFQRDHFENVPGCIGAGAGGSIFNFGWGYCYDPAASAVNPSPWVSPALQSPLGVDVGGSWCQFWKKASPGFAAAEAFENIALAIQKCHELGVAKCSYVTCDRRGCTAVRSSGALVDSDSDTYSYGRCNRDPDGGSWSRSPVNCVDVPGIVNCSVLDSMLVMRATLTAAQTAAIYRSIDPMIRTKCNGGPDIEAEYAIGRPYTFDGPQMAKGDIFVDANKGELGGVLYELTVSPFKPSNFQVNPASGQATYIPGEADRLRQGSTHQLRSAQSECRLADKRPLKAAGSVEECAAACSAAKGCELFTFRERGGWLETTTTGQDIDMHADTASPMYVEFKHGTAWSERELLFPSKSHCGSFGITCHKRFPAAVGASAIRFTPCGRWTSGLSYTQPQYCGWDGWGLARNRGGVGCSTNEIFASHVGIAPLCSFFDRICFAVLALETNCRFANICKTEFPRIGIVAGPSRTPKYKGISVHAMCVCTCERKIERDGPAAVFHIIRHTYRFQPS